MKHLIKSMLNTFLYEVPVFELMASSYKMRCLLRMALQFQHYLGRFRNNLSTMCIRVSSTEANISWWCKRTDTHAR